MPSLALFVESDKSKRDMLGRWRPSGADDYARTFRHVVVTFQVNISVALRSGEGAGLMQEADIVDRASRFLRERKYAEEELISTVCSAWSVELESFSKYLGRFSTCVVPAADLLSVPLPVHFPETTPITEGLSKEKVRLVRTNKFLISYSRDRRVARLHLAAKGCYWASSELKDSELLDKVNSSQYNARCKFCFPQLAAATILENESSSESSGSELDT